MRVLGPITFLMTLVTLVLAASPPDLDSTEYVVAYHRRHSRRPRRVKAPVKVPAPVVPIAPTTPLPLPTTTTKQRIQAGCLQTKCGCGPYEPQYPPFYRVSLHYFISPPPPPPLLSLSLYIYIYIFVCVGVGCTYLCVCVCTSGEVPIDFTRRH